MKALDKRLVEKKADPQRKLRGDEMLVENPDADKLLHKSGHLHEYNRLLEIKKGKMKKEKQEKMLFLSIGLCVSLLLVIGAFEYNFKGDNSTVDMAGTVQNFEDLLDVPQTDQPKPPPPKVEQPQIIEVPDETIIEQEIEVDLDVEITEESVIEDQVLTVDMGDEMREEEADEIFTIVEKQPSPVGGMKAFYAYVGENLKFPAMASRMDVQGRVFVQFVVEKDGSLTDIQVVKGIGAGCDEEAVRVISESPKWNPGKQRGRPVRVRMILPIVFKLVD